MMIDVTQRTASAERLRRLLNTSAVCITPYQDAVVEFVDGLVGAIKAEIRAEIAPQGGAGGAPGPAPDVPCPCCGSTESHSRGYGTDPATGETLRCFSCRLTWTRAVRDEDAPQGADGEPDLCRCPGPVAHCMDLGRESGHIYCDKCGKDIDMSARFEAIRADLTPAPSDAPQEEADAPPDPNWRSRHKPCKTCGTPIEEVSEFVPYVGWVVRHCKPEARVTCQCPEPDAHCVDLGRPSARIYCGTCGKDIDASARVEAIRAELSPPARVTCQCREPELYIPDGAGIICNQCGYEYTKGWDDLPPRAPKRDFGPHLCLCETGRTRDGKTCLDCGGEFFSPAAMPCDFGPPVMCG